MKSTESAFDKQVRTFLIACSMLNVLIGSSRLNEAADNYRWEFNNKNVEDAVNKAYKAYRNIDLNKLKNIWNAVTLSNLVSRILATMKLFLISLQSVKLVNIFMKLQKLQLYQIMGLI